jgi:hypothetical protein
VRSGRPIAVSGVRAEQGIVDAATEMTRRGHGKNILHREPAWFAGNKASR